MHTYNTCTSYKQIHWIYQLLCVYLNHKCDNKCSKEFKGEISFFMRAVSPPLCLTPAYNRLRWLALVLFRPLFLKHLGILNTSFLFVDSSRLFHSYLSSLLPLLVFFYFRGYCSSLIILFPPLPLIFLRRNFTYPFIQISSFRSVFDIFFFFFFWRVVL